MIPVRSDLHDFDEVDQTSRGRSNPTLVSLHFIRSALRRRWLVCVLFAVVGLLAAAVFLVASPQAHTAKTVLVLSHDSENDPSRAMSTDVSLLGTRTVATKTIASLGLTMAPDEFLKSVRVESVSSELMSITLTAPTDAEAIRRLEALTTIYLGFRGEQLTLQSNVLVTGMQQRIEKLQGEMAALSRRIEQLAASSTSSDSTLSDTIAQRAYIQGQVDTLRQSVEDATLRNASVVTSSRVIDPPATDAAGLKRRIVLTLASGLIGGAALGCGTVLFFAITSERLRRRSDVAAALEVAVPVSVGRIAPLPQRWLSVPYLRALDHRRMVERHRLAHAIEMELPSPRRWGPLGVVCIDNADEVRFAVVTAATNLAAEGCSVAVIDLTSQSNVELEAVSAMMDPGHKPTLLRPPGIPVLAASMADLRVVGEDDGTAPSLDHVDVTLVVADLDPSVGADYLVTWTDRVMIAVTAGRSSAEMVRTAADLVRTAGLEFRLAAVLRTERTDDSSGTAGFDLPEPLHLVDWHDHSESAAEFAQEAPVTNDLVQAGAEEQVVAEEQPIADELVVAEEQPAEEQLADLEQATTEEEAATAEEQPAEDQIQQPVDEEQVVVEEPPAAEQEPADLEQVVAEEHAADQEEPAADLDQAADPEFAVAEEQLQEHSADEQSVTGAHEAAAAGMIAASTTAPVRRRQRRGRQRKVDSTSTIVNAAAVPIDDTADAQLTADKQQAATIQEQAAIQEQAIDEQPATEEQAATEEQTLTEEQPADLEQATAEDETATEEQSAEDQIQEQPVAEELVVAEEQPAEEQLADLEQAIADEQAAEDEVQEQPVDEEQIQKQPADEKATAEEEATATTEEEAATADEQSAEDQIQQPVDEEQVVVEEPPAAEQEPADLEQVVAEEHAADQEEPAADLDQAADPEFAVAEEQLQEQSADEQLATGTQEAAAAGMIAASPTAPVRRRQRRGRQRKVDSTSTILHAAAVPIDDTADAQLTADKQQAATIQEQAVAEEHPAEEQLVDLEQATAGAPPPRTKAKSSPSLKNRFLMKNSQPPKNSSKSCLPTNNRWWRRSNRRPAIWPGRSGV